MVVPQLSASILALATALLPLSAGFVVTSGARSLGTKVSPAQVCSVVPSKMDEIDHMRMCS